VVLQHVSGRVPLVAIFHASPTMSYRRRTRPDSDLQAVIGLAATAVIIAQRGLGRAK
jgi:hypothetical protein